MASHMVRPARARAGHAPDLGVAQLRARAVRWLAQREHSRSELSARLLAWAENQQAAHEAALAADASEMAASASPAEAVEPDHRAHGGHAGRRQHARPEAPQPLVDLPQRVAEVMDQLAAQHWQSDERFVESRIHARQARWGTRRIVRELKQHGLNLAADTREQLDRTELARAQAIWARRYGAAPADAADFARQSRFLLARGFGHDTVRQVVPRPGQAGHSLDEDEAAV